MLTASETKKKQDEIFFNLKNHGIKKKIGTHKEEGGGLVYWPLSLVGKWKCCDGGFRLQQEWNYLLLKFGGELFIFGTAIFTPTEQLRGGSREAAQTEGGGRSFLLGKVEGTRRKAAHTHKHVNIHAIFSHTAVPLIIKLDIVSFLLTLIYNTICYLYTLITLCKWCTLIIFILLLFF